MLVNFFPGQMCIDQISVKALISAYSNIEITALIVLTSSRF